MPTPPPSQATSAPSTPENQPQPLPLEHVVRELLKDALIATEPVYWVRRADELDQGSTRDQELARACRQHAVLLGDSWVPRSRKGPDYERWICLTCHASYRGELGAQTPQHVCTPATSSAGDTA